MYVYILLSLIHCAATVATFLFFFFLLFNLLIYIFHFALFSRLQHKKRRYRNWMHMHPNRINKTEKKISGLLTMYSAYKKWYTKSDFASVFLKRSIQFYVCTSNIFCYRERDTIPNCYCTQCLYGASLWFLFTKSQLYNAKQFTKLNVAFSVHPFSLIGFSTVFFTFSVRFSSSSSSSLL